MKKEAEAIAAEKLEIVKREEITPEIAKARNIYKRLVNCGFKPSKMQELETDIIYQENKEKLQPIARRAGGMYVDTLSIIAAIMAIYSDIEA